MFEDGIDPGCFLLPIVAAAFLCLVYYLENDDTPEKIAAPPEIQRLVSDVDE